MKKIRLLFGDEVIQVLNLSEEQSRRSENYLSRNPCSADGKEKNSVSTSDSKRNSPCISDVEKKSSPSTYDNQRSSSYTFEKSESDHVFPRWGKTAKRGRKSSSKSAASHSSLSSVNNPKEPVFGEKELVDTLMHLWNLSNSYSIDSAKKETRIADKKRKVKVTNIVHYKDDGSKKARVENYRDENHEIMEKTISEATHKQIPRLSTGCRKFSCDNCGKSFSCHQALGGHKSSCNSNSSTTQIGESSLQGLMRNKKNQTDKSSKRFGTSEDGGHQCRICSKRFLNGWALGGHTKSHKTGQVEPSSIYISSVSPPKEITKESLYLINSFASSVPEAQEDIVEDKKIMMFDLNEEPPEDEDELDE